MKTLFKTLVVLAMVVTLGGCFMSWDTVKYQSTDKMIQTAPCEVATVEEAAPVVQKATKVKILEPVLFDFDKSVIRADQQPVIDKIASLMAEYEDTVLGIDAYASKEGPEKYNLKLSQRRADAVKAALVEKGISADRIVNSVGKGETGIFGELLKLNRRAIVLSVE